MFRFTLGMLYRIGDSNIEVDVVGSLVYYGALAVGGYLVYQHLFAKDSKKTSKPSRELGTKKADSEWLTDMQKPKQKSVVISSVCYALCTERIPFFLLDTSA